MNYVKHIFDWEKCSFEPTGNFSSNHRILGLRKGPASTLTSLSQNFNNAIINSNRKKIMKERKKEKLCKLN